LIPAQISDSGAELALAFWLLEEACVPSCWSDRIFVAECIRMLAKEGGTLEEAAGYILHQAKNAVAAGDVVNRFWFTDQKYKPSKPTVRPQPGMDFKGRSDEELAAERQSAYEVWQSCSEGYKALHPWGK
jgi:hypothetical protein